MLSVHFTVRNNDKFILYEFYERKLVLFNNKYIYSKRDVHVYMDLKIEFYFRNIKQPGVFMYNILCWRICFYMWLRRDTKQSHSKQTINSAIYNKHNNAASFAF